ncbi:hypothetical protein HZA99_02525 [Candidatus Woesearchaeota archaeon]|nr:hypothetical protein [Candidatus Woesearchaeota archaeon]
MKRIISIVFLILLLFTLGSCKKKETTEQPSEITGADQGNLFDDVLNDPSSQTTTQTTEEGTSSETTTSETETTNATTDYADPSCGDGICTYYETFSSCPEDCEKLKDVTLFDYPEFLQNGTLIVVGNDAPSTDVITATLIATYLVTQGVSTETKLAGEVSDYDSTDMILIGNPCDNAVIANLLHYSARTCANVVTEQNNAVIKLLVQDKNEIIIITGYDIGDTKDASEMLTDTTEKYNLNGAEEWINLANDEINLYFSKN